MKNQIKQVLVTAAAAVGILAAPVFSAPTLSVFPGLSGCSGAGPINVPATGGTADFHVCVNTSSPATLSCGVGYRLNASSSVGMSVTARTLGASYPDPLQANVTYLNGTNNLLDPDTTNAGAVVSDGVTPIAAGAAIFVASFTLTVPSGVPAAAYQIGTVGGNLNTTTDTCDSANAGDAPMADATINVVKAAAPPSVTIAASTLTLTDSGAQVSTITVTASNANPITVNLSPPAASSRYTTTCGSTIAVTTSATCTITATANTTPFDGNVSAAVSVVSGAGYTVGAPATVNVAVNNDDVPTATLSPATANVNDSGASQIVTVTLSAAAPAGGFAVPLTALAANARYSGTCVGATSITVPVGATTATCTVVGTANTVAGDGNVNAVVALNCAATCSNGAQATSTITVVDDDVPVISVTCTPTTLTDSAGQVATCSFSSDKAIGSTALAVTITPPAANARYTTTCVSPVNIPANTAANTAVVPCTITAAANTAIGDGSVTAALSVAAGAGYSVGGSTQNVVVNNDDVATITVAASPASVVENSGTPIVFTFTASAASSTATNIVFTPPAANPTRYTTTCVSPIVLPANATTVTCSATPVNTTVPDGTATVTVTLLASAADYTLGSPAAASGTITDDEVGVSVSGNGATEGSPVSFVLTCTGPAASTATVTFAISGQDAGAVITPAPGPVTVTCGTPTTVTVSTTNDAIQGNARSVGITLTNPVAPAVLVGAGTASASVLDNDAPLVVPTMSMLGLGFMSLMLAGFVAFQRRRVQK